MQRLRRTTLNCYEICFTNRIGIHVPVISAQSLRDFAASLFETVGVPEREAQICAGSLIGANLRGYDSHGVMRVPQYVDFLRKGA